MVRSDMRRIAVVTVGRSEYGIFRPLLRLLENDPTIELLLIVSGTHLSSDFGSSISEIHTDGFEIAAKVECTLASDQPGSVSRSMGLAAIGFAQTYEMLNPDLIVVLGDRFETHSAVVAAIPFLIPIAHIGGGCITRGAIDDGFRHSITKLSHLHFVETDEYQANIIKMGEDPSRVHKTGALGLDNLHAIKFLNLQEINREFNLKLSEPPILVTFHPVTRHFDKTEYYLKELLKALDKINCPIVITYPNADTAGKTIIRLIEEFAQSRHDKVFVVPHLGTQGYFSLMKIAVAMVGNSSSGLVEAASFRLPVVNIGERQEGRLESDNVISVGYNHRGILDGFKKAESSEFRSSLINVVNKYGDGKCAPRILDVIKMATLDKNLIIK